MKEQSEKKMEDSEYYLKFVYISFRLGDNRDWS